MDHWPIIRELGAAQGVSSDALKQWKRRGVPHRHRLPIMRAAAQRGLSIPDTAFDAPSPGTPSGTPDPAGPVGGDSGAGGALPDLTPAAAPDGGAA